MKFYVASGVTNRPVTNIYLEITGGGSMYPPPP